MHRGLDFEEVLDYLLEVGWRKRQRVRTRERMSGVLSTVFRVVGPMGVVESGKVVKAVERWMVDTPAVYNKLDPTKLHPIFNQSPYYDDIYIYMQQI